MGNCLGFLFKKCLRPRSLRVPPATETELQNEPEVEISSSTTSLRSRSEERSSTNDLGHEFSGAAETGVVAPATAGIDRCIYPNSQKYSIPLSALPGR